MFLLSVVQISIKSHLIKTCLKTTGLFSAMQSIHFSSTNLWIMWKSKNELSSLKKKSSKDHIFNRGRWDRNQKVKLIIATKKGFTLLYSVSEPISQENVLNQFYLIKKSWVKMRCTFFWKTFTRFHPLQ